MASNDSDSDDEDIVPRIQVESGEGGGGLVDSEDEVEGGPSRRSGRIAEVVELRQRKYSRRGELLRRARNRRRADIAARSGESSSSGGDGDSLGGNDVGAEFGFLTLISALK